MTKATGKKRRRGKAIAAAVVGQDAIRDVAIHMAPTIGAAAKTVAFETVARFGRAGTGKVIRELVGIARENATLARAGNGPKANGGRGMAGGGKVLAAVDTAATAAALAVAVASIVIQAWAKTKAETEAQADTAAVANEPEGGSAAE